MSPRAIRRIIVIVFALGAAGIIVGSLRDNNNGFAITAGLITAVAALGLILVTSVAPAGSLAKPTKGSDTTDGEAPPVQVDETIAADVERRVSELVAAGADEDEVRRLVTQAVNLGRSTRRSTTR